MRHHVVGRVEPLAVEHGRDDARRPVELVAHHAPGDVLAGELAALEVERVAVAVVRRRAEHADVAVVLDPPELPVVRDVAPHQIAALRAPRRPFRPERAGPQPLDRGVRLPQAVEGGLHGEHVGIGEVGGGCPAGAEVARGAGDRAGRGHRPAGRGLRARQPRHEHRGAHRRAHAAEHHAPRHRGAGFRIVRFLRHCDLPEMSSLERKRGETIRGATLADGRRSVKSRRMIGGAVRTPGGGAR